MSPPGGGGYKMLRPGACLFVIFPGLPDKGEGASRAQKHRPLSHVLTQRAVRLRSLELAGA